ncbi:pyridoxal phosphate-dependent aminotransferase family protein [uncultured Tenacibaculum sp.]|uniref:aminotransferase class I/II-fold pyridoxal phosphate-dependent enzyme n=1 Tax=uncultured Tenacibaculum sp. TaxID=174713 RepID=UPI00261E1090|nr:pyridoxal phosphate-dependent aminotransferase family protein [uncultured Tenacibaculum sp.]
MDLPIKLQQKLDNRIAQNAYRKLGDQHTITDFSSNDYIGFASSEAIFEKTHEFLTKNKIKTNGATGSRLLSGNHSMYTIVEEQLNAVHATEASLIFNSGYDANLGFFSSVPQRGDVILYDEFIHASIRDGIQLSNAKSYKFKHNNIEHLEEMLLRFQQENSSVFVVTESVFSMDGDTPDLVSMAKLCNTTQAYFIIDEAHALGVFSDGLVQELNLVNDVFARIITFGKGLGCHGAAILGGKDLINYLVNFARSFIYTTGLSPHALATIQTAYTYLKSKKGKELQFQLTENILFFKKETQRLNLNFIESDSAIHCCIISGNEKVKEIASQLQKNGFHVKPILSPTVPKNQERLRFCLHSYNSKEEITNVLEQLATFVL